MALLALKLFLSSAQKMYLQPEGAVLDDMLMYNAAVSITKGEWLGTYGWLTLSKHGFFAVWLALLHLLGIPYLMGGQLLWAAASALAAVAFVPAVKNRFVSLLLYAVLLFSPSSTANPMPFGFVLRVYRDNIFPALCLLCVAGVVGFALRYQQKHWYCIVWPILAGVALAACWLTREDGWWLLPFVTVASVVILVFIVRSQLAHKWRRCALLLVPFFLLAAGDLAWRSINLQVYGRFVISDFSSGEFADAYGAMTRIEHESWNPKVAVPKDVRQKLYENIPAFAELAPALESQLYYAQYATEDYSSGAFYWALRQAAAEAGYYETPQKAQAYFEGLARDINALCEAGVLPAGAKRSSVNPPIRAEYILPVLRESGYNIVFCSTFEQCDARSMFSPHSNDPGMYQQLIAPMEAFLHDKAQTITLENSEKPYFLPLENLRFKVLDMARWCYAILLPTLLLAACIWHCMAGGQLIKRMRSKQANAEQNLLWFVQLGLLFCIVLRVAMVAFVTVSSFEIGTYVMYLASVHPLMILFGGVGTIQFVRWGIQKRAEKKRTPLGEGGRI